MPPCQAALRGYALRGTAGFPARLGRLTGLAVDADICAQPP